MQEMVAGLRRNGINTVFIPIEDVCNKLPQHVKDYQAKNICVISDYSKRFSLWRMTWKCKYQYGVRVCCSVGAFTSITEHQKSKTMLITLFPISI